MFTNNGTKINNKDAKNSCKNIIFDACNHNWQQKNISNVFDIKKYVHTIKIVL